VGLALAACCVLGLFGAAPRQLHVGYSAEGRPIEAYVLGNGPVSVLVVGGIHGAPELNSSALVWGLLDYFQENPDAIPSGLSLLFVPEANPDGIADGMRELADGVDPNRNWPTEDWVPGTYGPQGKWLPDGGGDEPLSEPETVALADLVEKTHPVVAFSYHSAAGYAMGGPAAERSGVLAAYVASSGYPAHDFQAYPVTGDFAQWLDDLDIPTVEVELTDHWNPELERNLAGVEAVLDGIAGDDQPY
jgi:murein peptide amidase A